MEALQGAFGGKKNKIIMGSKNPQNTEARIAAGEEISPAERKAYEQWKASKKVKKDMGA